MTNVKCQMTNEGIIKLLDGLKDRVNLFAPQKDEYGDTYLALVSDVNKVQLKHFKPVLPAVREILFGQVQKMIRYAKQAGVTKLEEIDESAETVIFGLPSCDVEAIVYNDNFFAGREFVDPYYKKARDKLTLISLVCLTPPNDSCFCASMGHGPAAKSGFDLQLTDLGNGKFMVEIGSEKGKKTINNLFVKAGDHDVQKQKDLLDKAFDLAGKKEINKEKVLEKMGRDALDENLIKDIGNRCISCGACNYTCPTCTCFNVIDLGNEKGGVRKKILDACIMGGYFRMAGGHNPKPDKIQRTRNRYFCKLIWDKEKFGDSGCVGCGRCLDSCPVDIDIKKVMQSITPCLPAGREGK